MAHTADPLNSAPLDSNPGDQNAANDVSRELLDQLASTFRPSWEPDQAPFTGKADLSPGEIQALASGGTAPELRAESHATLGPLAPPKPTQVLEPTESVIVQGAPAPAMGFQGVGPGETGAPGPSPKIAAPGTVGLPEDTAADVSPPFSHDSGAAPVSPFPLADDLGQAHPAVPFPLAHDAEGVAYPAAPFPLRTAAAAAREAAREGVTARSPSVRPPPAGDEAPLRGPSPAAFPEGGRPLSVRPGMRTFDTPEAARRPSRPPLASIDLEVARFTRRSRAPLWIGIGVAAAALLGAVVWFFGGGSTSPSSPTSTAAATVETAALPVPARPLTTRAEPAIEAPSPPQPNPLAAPPPAFPTAATAASEPPATALPATAPPSIPVTALPPAPRPAPHSGAPSAPKPVAHPKPGNPTIVRDVPF